jgi:phage terminase large subunit-like protein
MSADVLTEVARLDPAMQERVLREWRVWARREQLPPPGDWRVWLILAGRGWGKSRTGAEWVRAQVASGRAKRIALVARTASDVRDVIVEGESGLLAIHRADERPTWEPSRRRLTWPNGAIATTYSAEEPDQLRGPQHDLAWADELSAWRYPDAWDQLRFGLRLGDDPRIVVTTTPRPTPIIKALVSSPRTVVTRGRTRDNARNLAPGVVAELESRYAGSRLGRQELDGEVLDDAAGALWSWDVIESGRVSTAPRMMTSAVFLDPNAAQAETAERCDDAGIVVIGKGFDGRGYVIDDASGHMPVRDWARRAVALYRKHACAYIGAERNLGGPMIQQTIRAVLLEEAQATGRAPEHIEVKLISVRGEKAQRSAAARQLYPHVVSHVGAHPRLEDSMTTHDYASSKRSAGDLDALSLGCSDLMLQQPEPTRLVVEEHYDF